MRRQILALLMEKSHQKQKKGFQQNHLESFKYRKFSEDQKWLENLSLEFSFWDVTRTS